MQSFHDFKISNPLLNALEDLGFDTPTPVQAESYSIVLSGKDVVGIAQTGTGKTFAYLLPILQNLKYSDQTSPRVLILVPTRELVVQVAEQAELLSKYKNVRIQGVFGGVNMRTQAQKLAEGVDVLVATPGRLYDLALNRSVQLKTIKQVVIDEVDVMLDLGFRFQLNNIAELLPEKRQNIMFSATMTEEVDALIKANFRAPERINIAVSGTPLHNISQASYHVKNFYTKANLLAHLLRDTEQFTKVLVFAGSKKYADRLFNYLEEDYGEEMAVVHGNKSQNYRLRSLRQFDEGHNRILITTDVMARGIDLEKITHVINMDVPVFPENYMHRIGRTGRAEEKGEAYLFYTEAEEAAKKRIEALMDMPIPELPFPEEVEVSKELTPDERPKEGTTLPPQKIKVEYKGEAFHEKKDKNKKVNLGGKQKRKLSAKYKKSQTRGDKVQNRKSKKKR